MGAITYLKEVPSGMKPLERVMLMEEMGKVWASWPSCVERNDIDAWKWGIILSHHRPAERQRVLVQALSDVCNYERCVHGAEAEVNGVKWNSIIAHILDKATY